MSRGQVETTTCTIVQRRRATIGPNRLDQTTCLIAMKAYLSAKIDWLKGGERGAQPDFPETAD
jgi:hypothetical protein